MKNSVSLLSILLAASLLLFTIPTFAHAQPSSISNFFPRRDVDGNIVDAHDGCLMYFNGSYYLYGTRYGTTDGFGNTNRYVCYSSPDLVTWTLRGECLKDAPSRLYYRPYVIYNKTTHKYVMWYNADSEYGVAVSDKPEGPFVVVNPNAPVKYAARSVGDLGLFVDSDGTAYITYTNGGDGSTFNVKTEPIPHHQICVERLSADYLAPTGQTGDLVAGNVEAPAMFKRNDTYYLLFDNTCAFGIYGSGARVYTAVAPLGPYTYRGNINVKAASARNLPITWTWPGTGRPDCIIRAQQTFVATLPTSHGTAYIWMGDEWGSRPDGIKGHDYQYWSSPLQFEKDGMIKQLKWDSSIGDKNFNVSHKSKNIIKIENAQYGDFSSKANAKTIDVTTVVQNLIDNGPPTFPVSLLVKLVPDPDFGVVKTLKVQYKSNGNEHNATASDDQVISLSVEENPT
jgi:hypothetical protein